MDQIRRSSKKRQAVYDALCATHSHPSAEQLFSTLKPSIPELSLGTVYRNLDVLMQDGLIISVGKVNGQERYDANVKPHAHLVCSCCGKVDDFFGELKLPEYAELESVTGWELSSHSLTYAGLCEDCVKSKKSLGSIRRAI